MAYVIDRFYTENRKGVLKMLRRIFVICIALSAVIFSCQESHCLSMGPSRFEVSLPPGETAGADYYVQNDTEEPIHVVVEPENWYTDAYDYKDLPIGDWIDVDTYEFDLQPKEIRKLKLTIRVPADRAGELVAQIFFSSAVSGAAEGAGSSIQARLGAVLYVAIKGTEKVDAEVRGIGITRVSDPDAYALKMNVPVWNKGNVHLRPIGTVVIEDEKNARVGTAEILSGKAVLPNQIVDFDAFCKAPELSAGKYKAAAKVTYGEVFGMEKESAYERAFEIGKDGEVVKK